MIVSTKEHIYFLGEEGNQYRVKQKGGSENEGKFWDSNSPSFIFHTNSTHLVFSEQFSYFLHNVFKGWEYIEEKTKLFREDKLCWISAKTEIWGIIISISPFILNPPIF